MKWRQFVLALTMAMSLPAAAQQRSSGRGDAAWLTLYEVEWCKHVLPRIESQPAVTTTSREAQWYVAGIATRLAHAAPEPETFQYRFIVYDDNVGLTLPWFGTLKHTNQVHALPGGIVLIPVRLFEATSDEAEFAAAIARGIAHLVLKHFTRTALRASIVRPIPPASNIFEWGWQPFPKALMFSRSFEREADIAALNILAGAGFDPEALRRYIADKRASFDTSDPRVRAVELALSKRQPHPWCPTDSTQFNELKARMARRVVV